MLSIGRIIKGDPRQLFVYGSQHGKFTQYVFQGKIEPVRCALPVNYNMLSAKEPPLHVNPSFETYAPEVLIGPATGNQFMDVFVSNTMKMAQFMPVYFKQKVSVEALREMIDPDYIALYNNRMLADHWTERLNEWGNNMVQDWDKISKMDYFIRPFGNSAEMRIDDDMMITFKYAGAIVGFSKR